MAELFRGCSKVGIQVPRMTIVPDPVIVWHDGRSTFPGETMVAAFEAAKGFFKRDPDIIFVVLPERGAPICRNIFRTDLCQATPREYP